jgi:hypothetical protein
MKPILFSILFMMISCITFSQEKVYINQDIKNADNSYILKESTVINTPNLLIEKGAKTSVQRKPLHEVFTSSTCGYCPAANAAIDAVALNPNNIDDCTVIKYQVSWPSPGDPYNTPEVGQRRSYYGVTGVPAFYVDANEDSGAAYTQTKLNNYAAVPAYFEIEATHTIVGYDIEVDITITPYMDWQGKCRVAVVERQTTGNVGSNGETEFHNVMMKMLPNPTGTVVNLISGTPYSFQLSGNLASTFIEEMYDLEVVVFLQDDSNKDVMQSNYSEFVPSATDVILTDLNVTNTYSDCALGNAEAVSIEIYNFGADPVSDIEVSYTIDGGEIVEETLAGPIAPMESVDYTFSQTADLSEVGVHNIVASISYSNDEILTNNELDINAVSGDAVLNIYIDFDNYPGETSWELYDDKLDVIVATGSGYTGGATNENYCVISTHCYEFTIYDSYGDGICCSYGSGSYSVTYFGDEVASGGNFTSSESTSIDAVLDLTFDEEMWFCTGETITWETNGSGTFSHETSEIDNLTPSITTVIYTLNEGSDCEISTSFDIIVVDNNIDIANDDIVICAGETVEYPIGYGSFAPETIDNLTPATTTVIYTINEGMSCENTTSFDITVNPIPEIDIVCEDLSFCLNNTVELPTGSGTFSPATIDNTTPGITTVTYTTAENAEGCVDSCSFDVEIINTVIDITPEDIVVCLGQEIIFPDGENGIFDPASIDNMIAGTTTVTYIIADGTECENTTSFDVTVNALPEIDISCEDLVFCSSESLVFPEGTGVFEPNTVVEPITDITYTTLPSTDGCVDSCEFIIEVINNEIDITAENITVCQGEVIEFYGGTNGVYSPASVDNMIVGTTTVQYIVAGESDCENIVEFDVTVLEVPAAEISVNDEYLLSSEAVGSLQWYFNDDAIEGATGNTYQCTEDGDYYLIVIAQNDCSTQSNTINVTGTFSDFEALELIEVYPNPASDRITITNVQNCSLYIYNVSGQLVKTINNSDKKLDIDTKYLAEGLYTIKIIKEGLVLVKQIVIEK